jgi:hypothetical protein
MNPTGRLDSITTLINHHMSRIENESVGDMTNFEVEERKQRKKSGAMTQDSDKGNGLDGNPPKRTPGSASPGSAA